MSEPVAININVISQNLKIPVEHIQAVIELLEQGFPPPFIARYRRDESNNLSEEKIRRIALQYKELQQFTQRKETILRNIASTGKLDELLEKRIREARTKKRLDDLQSPFRPQKDEAVAKARQAGLDDLVTEILQAADPDVSLESLAAKRIAPEKGWTTADDVLREALPLLAERMSESIEVRNSLRDALRQHGVIKSQRVVAEIPEVEPIVSETNPAEPALAKPEQPVAQPAPQSDQTDSSSPESTTTALPAEPESTQAQSEPADTKADHQEVPEASPSAEESAQATAPSAVSSSDPNASESAPGTAEATPDATETNAVSEPNTVSAKPAASAKPNVSPAQTRRQKEKEKKQAARKREEEAQNKAFKEYFNGSVNVSSCSLYTIQDLNNGQRSGVLALEVVLPAGHGHDKALADLVPDNHPYRDYLRPIAAHVVDNKLIPFLKKELLSDLFQQAQDLIIRNLAKNLRNLLFHKSLTGYRVLAFMPNFSRGCKLVALDEYGNVLAHDSVYITGSAERKAKAQTRIRELIDKYHLSIVAIGTGTGEREAQIFFSKLIQDFYADKDLVFVPVNNIGAEAWSTSPAAREEFPSFNALIRETICIGRRLLNPVAELTKIDPLNLVIGLRQTDSKPRNLKDALVEVLELAVNRLGGNLNRMEDTQLRYISGLNNALAKRICEYRRQNGPFRRREDLKKVPGFNEAVYRNCVGFLRIPNGFEPFDATWIHPDFYPLAESILSKAGFTKDDLFDPQRQPLLAETLRTFRFDDLVAEFQAGYHTIREIVQQLSHPGEENRQEFVLPIFKQVLLKPENLEPGKELIGMVTSIVNFGAFVDIGALNSGLVHISHMGHNYVKSPQDKVSIGQIVSVWILNYDTKHNHLSLSMLSPEAEKEEQRKARSRNEQGRPATASAPTDHNQSDRNPGDRRGRDDRRSYRDRGEGERTATSQDARSGRIARKPESDGRGRSRDDSARDGGRARPNRDSRGDRRQDSESSRRRGDKANDRHGDSTTRMVVEPQKKKLTPISEEMKNGKAPLRSFSDLAQLFGRIQPEAAPSSSAEGKKGQKTDSQEKKSKPASEAPAQSPSPVENNVENRDQK